jgi:poly-gamma-glutamate synthesis protein (capsule biosynthesis protein)
VLPGEPVLIDHDGYAIGIAGSAYNIGLDMEALRADLAALKEKGADFVVVSMHAGIEYAILPSKAQENFAHEAIDAGANLVVGHHPHVVQKAEEYNGGYIVYSLGNFIFDQFFSEATMHGVVLQAELKGSEVTYTQRPIVINTKAQPSWLALEEEP